MGRLTTRRALLGSALGAVALQAWGRTSGPVFTGFAGTEVRFADLASAAAVLSADDAWMRATGDFQRRAVTGRDEPVTLEAFRRFNGEAARAWRDDARARWTQALQTLAPAFASLRIPLPPVVQLVSTSGQESADAPYTRANAVMLPEHARTPGITDAALMAHELWHVASRHAPALASRLYALIGFEPMRPLRFPQAWQDIRIANPDAPDNAHAMRLRIDGREVWVAPVLVAGRTTLQPGEVFFQVMQVRLLEVQPDATPDASLPVIGEAGPRWHPLNGPHDFLRNLGGNTGYVLHPEEVMADNVALLATGGRARNPALLERIRSVLRAG